ncbi:RuvA C-terminal domain-containing protein [Arachidicoccus sp.]|uniref:RuvA C-terminal domain-containing protein n=1 Tax=Arachidicoccus sp. TaxID=1872624 RepID=UPI003D1B7366
MQKQFGLNLKKDKLAKQHDLNVVGTTSFVSSIESDALDTLMALGIGKSMAENAIKKTLKLAEDNMNLETLIKVSPKNL